MKRNLLTRLRPSVINVNNRRANVQVDDSGSIYQQSSGCSSYNVTNYIITGLDRPLGLQEVETPKISRKLAYESDKVVSPTHRPPLSPRDISSTHFYYRLSQPQGA